MTNWNASRLITFALIVLAVLAADQFSKYLVLKYIPLHGGFEVIRDHVNLVHARNTGGAFGLWAGTSGWFFTGISVVALAAVFWLLLSARDDEVLLTIGYSLFFGGALGNLVPSAWRTVGWLILLLVSGLSVGAMLLFLRRTENRTIFAAFLVYAGVDVLLSALVLIVPTIM